MQVNQQKSRNQLSDSPTNSKDDQNRIGKDSNSRSTNKNDETPNLTPEGLNNDQCYINQNSEQQLHCGKPEVVAQGNQLVQFLYNDSYQAMSQQQYYSIINVISNNEKHKKQLQDKNIEENDKWKAFINESPKQQQLQSPQFTKEIIQLFRELVQNLQIQTNIISIPPDFIKKKVTFTLSQLYKEQNYDGQSFKYEKKFLIDIEIIFQQNYSESNENTEEDGQQNTILITNYHLDEASAYSASVEFQTNMDGYFWDQNTKQIQIFQKIFIFEHNLISHILFAVDKIILLQFMLYDYIKYVQQGDKSKNKTVIQNVLKSKLADSSIKDLRDQWKPFF